MRKFIGGKYEGTNLEIMPSKAATQLPDGTPIQSKRLTSQLSPTQQRHNEGKLDVHEPQVFKIHEYGDEHTLYQGPSIAQEWKLLMQGKRPFYRNMGRTQ